MTAVYLASSSFRRSISTKKVEEMLPSLVDFATISTSGKGSFGSKREAAIEWLAAIISKSRTRLPNSVITQVRQNLIQLSQRKHVLTVSQIQLIIEQLRSSPASPKVATAALGPMTPASPRTSVSYFGTSFSSRFGTSPPSSPVMPGVRRRPSTEAGGLSRAILEKRAPLKRVLTGESILEGGKDKNSAWKLIIIQTVRRDSRPLIAKWPVDGRRIHKRTQR